jgi:hypothetical protein
MIPKILLQVSREPFLDEVNAGWAERNGCGWKIDWYDDERILEYFDENPLPEFPNIVDVFNSFTGAHKSDLFRYYYLYLNGGVFCDSDLMLTGDLSELDIDGHDHLFTVCDLDMNVNAEVSLNGENFLLGTTVFNGFIGAKPNSEIIYDALVNAYTTTPETLHQHYLYFCQEMYHIMVKHKDKYDIKLFEEYMIGGIDNVSHVIESGVDGAQNVIAVHFFEEDKYIPFDYIEYIKNIKINKG